MTHRRTRRLSGGKPQAPLTFLSCAASLSVQERNILVLSDMHAGSLYRLDVQAVTEDGDGPATSRTFQTPAHRSVPKPSETAHSNGCSVLGQHRRFTSRYTSCPYYHL